MITTVTFVDTQVVPAHVSGVQAKLYQGSTFISSAVSGEDGVVTWDLAVGLYSMVVSIPSKPGYTVTNPYTVEVRASGSNSFGVSIEMYQLPLPDDPDTLDRKSVV